MKAKKRKLSPAQLAALARGRAKRSKNLGKAVSGMATKTKKKTSVSHVRKAPETQIIVAGTKKKRRRSRGGRLMGGLGNLNVKNIQSGLINTAIGTAGGIGGAMVARYIPTADARLKAAAVLGVGLLLGTLVKNVKVQAAAQGMCIVGGMSLVKALRPETPTMLGDADFEGLIDSPMGEIVEDLGEIAEDEIAGYIEEGLEGDDVSTFPSVLDNVA